MRYISKYNSNISYILKHINYAKVFLVGDVRGDGYRGKLDCSP